MAYWGSVLTGTSNPIPPSFIDCYSQSTSSPPPPDSLYADPKSIEHQAAPGTEDQYIVVNKKGKKNTKPDPTPPEALYQVLLYHIYALEVFRMYDVLTLYIYLLTVSLCEPICEYFFGP